MFFFFSFAIPLPFLFLCFYHNTHPYIYFLQHKGDSVIFYVYFIFLLELFRRKFRTLNFIRLFFTICTRFFVVVVCLFFHFHVSNEICKQVFFLQFIIRSVEYIHMYILSSWILFLCWLTLGLVSRKIVFSFILVFFGYDLYFFVSEIFTSVLICSVVSFDRI